MKFSDSLDRKLEEIQRPPNPPIGTYQWAVEKTPAYEEFTSKAGDGFEKLTFLLSCVEATDDVDPDDLAAYGNVQGMKQRKQFFFPTGDDKATEYARSEFNLRRFLDHLGIDETLSLGEAINACVGSQCLAELTHRPDPNDDEIVYAEVGRTAPV